MTSLPYTIIKSSKQYSKYCKTLEVLMDTPNKTKTIKDTIELLILLIEKYDIENNSFDDADPITLLKSLMKAHEIKAVELAKFLNVSEGLVSDILHYKKGLSKDSIRLLANRFKLRQEAFNRPYTLQLPQLKKQRKVTLKT